MRCCRLMSEISRLLTIADSSVATRTTTCLTCAALDERIERVERCLDRRADRPLLDVGPHDFEPCSKRFDDHPWVVLWDKSLEEVVSPRQDVVDAGSTRLDEQRRRDPVARAHATEVERFLDVIDVALPRRQARRLLRGVREQPMPCVLR